MKNFNEDKHLCFDCKYRTGYAEHDIMCYYIIKTGHRRPCDWRNCSVYEKDTERKIPKKIQEFLESYYNE